MKHPYLAKLWLLLFFSGFGLISSAQAQTGTVSGQVSDAKKSGIPGATVIIDGTKLGSSANADGTYSIQNVPAGPQTIVVSYVGYNTVRLPVTVVAGQNAEVSASLTESATALGEAVVIGYGTQRRQDLTGAVEQIDSKQFVKGQVTNPEQLIQGKVAGVQITTGGGAPGAGSEIRIRGGSSLSASNAPLIVIDGVPVDNTGLAGASNPLTLINPNDIESITVLKDASSTAIYGVRASNGVILVTTKKGAIGDGIHVNVSTQNSVSNVYKYVPVLSADDFRAVVNQYGTAAQKKTLGTANTDWQKEIFRTAYTSDNNASISGSVGTLPYRASVGYLTQEGILKRNDLKRWSGALNLSPVLLDGKLRVNLNVKGTWIDNNFSDQGAVGAAVNFDPTQPANVDADLTKPAAVYTGAAGNPFGLTNAQINQYGGYSEYSQVNDDKTVSLNTLSPRNPLGLINQSRNRSSVKRSIGNLQLDYKLPFVPGLSANLNLGYDIQRGRGTNFIPAEAASNFNRKGVNNNYSQDLNNTILEAYGKYERNIGPGKLEFLAGYSYQRFENRSYVFADYRADGSELNPVSLSYSGESVYPNVNVLVSYYSRLNYNIQGKYIFTGTIRADGTSRFNPSHFGYFPSGAFAWRIKGEEFLKNSSAVSDLKLRLGYGKTGQQDAGGYYPYLANLSLSSLTSQYQLGYNPDGSPRYIRTLRPDQYNGAISWETTTTYNAGLDYGFLDGRVYGSVDVYSRETNGLLNYINIPALSGLSNAGTYNVGSLTNKGVEAILNLEVVKTDRLNITVNTNATFNRNELTKLTGADSPQDLGQPTGGISGGVGNNIQINTVGYAANTFYVNQQVYGADGKPLQGIYVDRNGDGVIDSKDRYRYKNIRPTAILGGGATVNYHNFNLAFTLRANIGNYVYNNVRSGSFYDISTNGFVPNRNQEILTSGFTSAQYYSDYFIENASFLRMENLTLGYNFGEIIRKGSNVNLSFAVQNLFVVTNYKGLDPEVSGGIDNTIYPRPRTFTVGLNVGI